MAAPSEGTNNLRGNCEPNLNFNRINFNRIKLPTPTHALPFCHYRVLLLAASAGSAL